MLNEMNDFNPAQYLFELIMCIFSLTGSLRLLFLSQVISRLLCLPEDYWRRVLSAQTDQISSSTSKTCSQEDGHGLFIYVESLVI